MYNLAVGNEQINIYEYQDAEALIKELAAKYSHDITTIARGGRGRNKTDWYNYPCAFDIETTTYRSGELGYNHPDGRPAALPYLFQFNIYGCVIMVRYIEQAMDIFNWLGDYFIAGRKRRLAIFDHNLAYEYGFFKDYWRLNNKECFALDIHHPVTLVLTNGLIIRDSYKLTNMSLETLTKDWSVKYKKNKEIMDYSAKRAPWDQLDAQTLEYSALDVLSLSDAIGQYLKARSTGVWTKSPTSTSFIRAAFKETIGIGNKHRTKEQKQYFKTLDKCKIDADIYNMLLRQARGGNTHANRAITGEFIGTLEGRGVVHFDITSSYPAQMVCYPEYPINVWRKLDADANINDLMFLEDNGFCTLFDIVLIEPKIKVGVTVPYLANSKCRTLKGVPRYSDNGRYLEGSAMLETTIYGIEWPIIASQYDFSDTVVLRGYYARKGYLPDILRRFVLELYAKKTELKGVEGQEVEYSLAKTYVNGVYGMSFTRIIREVCEFDDKGIYIKPEEDISETLKKHQSGSSYFLCYAWGAMVATLGRVYLQKMIDAVGADFLYCDTDSVFTKSPERSRAAIRALNDRITAKQRECGLNLQYSDIKGRMHELGAIDEEPECSFKTFGAKKYITIENGELKCTIAGVPKKEGSRLITGPDDFYIGKVFAGRDTNKLCLWYNDDEGLIFTDGQHSVSVKSNIAMLPVDYILGLSNDYRMCLQVEGVNSVYSFKEANVNMNEEYI